MASRLFSRDISSLDNNVVKLFGKVTFGATTSVSSQDCNGMVVSALGTGTIDVQLGSASAPDKYPKLLAVSLTPLSSAATDTGWQMIEESIATDGTFSLRNAPGGVATAPATGSSLFILVSVRNSGTPRKGT